MLVLSLTLAKNILVVLGILELGLSLRFKVQM